MIQYNETLSYEIKSNGYLIYRNEELWLTQLDRYAKPYDANKSYEENCLMQLADLTRPVEPPNNDYGVDNYIFNQIIDDYTNELIEGGII